MSQHPGHGWPPGDNGEQPRFGPTITEQMRLQGPVAPPQQPYRPVPHQQPWTTQAIRLPGEQKQWSPQRIAALVGVGVLALVLVFMLLIMLLVMGPATLVIVPLAALPPLVIIAVIWLMDRWHPQSPLMMALCVLWGAVASVIMTLVLGLGAEIGFAIAFGEPPGWVGPVVFAPLFEETSKALLLLIILLAARKHFDGPFQGLMFGSLIGIGFAFTEDILYISMASVEGGLVAGGATFFLRGILTPFAHVVFTGAIGMIMGFGARRPGMGWGFAMLVAGLPVGMVLHALWNLAAVVSATEPLLAFIISALMGFLSFAAWLTAALLLRHDEVKRTRQALREYVRSGWMTPEEVTMFGSWSGRRRATTWASRYPGAKKVMLRMIRISARLAVLRHRILLNPGHTQSERTAEVKLLHAFTQLRGELLRRTTPAPMPAPSPGPFPGPPPGGHPGSPAGHYPPPGHHPHPGQHAGQHPHSGHHPHPGQHPPRLR
ncbi:PrsW family intramembrane metalloprotease [Nesterenkonia alba]|uniref:PrsW family intramembrane metalloprotease n=1 Tax=Nesterenkonia alba TaxID=515814 RepID=UPI0003B483C6|nr:PrsW family intramembrane metalloprotease [Nesterenkonia alba]